jgi:energy-coupling factor transporter ATP-binding protein EcfA2
MPAPIAVPSGGRGTKVLGKAEIGGHSVALKVPDARQHTHVLGSTGSGKSTLLLNMILDDIHARRGTIVIDPKGDLIIDLLDRIPAKFAKRLVLIDPDQPEGTTLNLLAGDDHDLVVDNVVSIFGKIFQKHWGPRMDDVLRVACLTLLRKANATLTLIPSLLQDRQFRYNFTQDLDDPEGLRGFWEWYETAPVPLRSQVIAPLLSRLRSVLLRDPLDGQVREQWLEHRRVPGLAGRHRDHQRPATAIDKLVDLGRHPAPGTSQRVIGRLLTQAGAQILVTRLSPPRGDRLSSQGRRPAGSSTRDRVVACWWARLIVESTDTVQSTSPTASASATSRAWILSQVASAENRLCRFNSVCHGPNTSGRSRHAIPVRNR